MIARAFEIVWYLKFEDVTMSVIPVFGNPGRIWGFGIDNLS
jgi:hypothetical protein